MESYRSVIPSRPFAGGRNPRWHVSLIYNPAPPLFPLGMINKVCGPRTAPSPAPSHSFPSSYDICVAPALPHVCDPALAPFFVYENPFYLIFQRPPRLPAANTYRLQSRHPEVFYLIVQPGLFSPTLPPFLASGQSASSLVFLMQASHPPGPVPPLPHPGAHPGQEDATPNRVMPLPSSLPVSTLVAPPKLTLSSLKRVRTGPLSCQRPPRQ